MADGARNLASKTPSPVLGKSLVLISKIRENLRRMKELEDTIDECVRECGDRDARRGE